jgi:hypothetical protein
MSGLASQENENIKQTILDKVYDNPNDAIINVHERPEAVRFLNGNHKL